MTSLLSFTIISLILASSAYTQVMSTPLSATVRILASPGANVTLPCALLSKDTVHFGSIGIRIKWTKVADDEALNEDVLLSMGFHKKTYGRFDNRVFMETEDPDSEDASITIIDVAPEDSGKYRCEIMNGMEDTVQDVTLEVQGYDGVVFPYSPNVGRYNLNFDAAVKACTDQDAVVASFDQLFEAWRGGLDWCNAGWLNDGTVQYPITKPREPCGGSNNRPGLRNYGQRDKQMSRYDVFCYASALEGDFYWLDQPNRLTFDEAVQACLDDEAEIAKVSHIYAAWKLNSYDRCDAGWLADGSVRYPISRPRKNCSPTEAAVRFVGFPDKNQQSFGVYCFKAQKTVSR
ncbi:hyaluronan and proteoglycan link protein 1 [Mastacembelus armatus]|uniref:hyaluronan and proteoglycan link protein 1 n=1 Tax=Mastacembelus armatus TaxID=205130 RepID=UPI000E463B9B|nr:hyaluronan and proteoglycan link protein 1 [Mastacembelus armatus]